MPVSTRFSDEYQKAADALGKAQPPQPWRGTLASLAALVAAEGPHASHADALTALSHGNAVVAEAHVRRAMLEAWTSPDLTRADRTRVSTEIKRTFQEARSLGLGLERAPATLAGAMAGALPADAVGRLQPPSLEALLDLGE